MLKRFSNFLLPVIILAFLVVFGRFLYLRFSSGDVYPAYSSFRTDPVGTKAFYESLGRLEGITALRQFEDLRTVKADSHTTFFFLGLHPGALSGENDEITEIARNGGRVILSFDARPSIGLEREQDRIKAGRPVLRTNTPPVMTGEAALGQFAGLHLQILDPLKRDTNMFEARCALESAAELPWSLPWYGHYWIDGATNNWETIYAVKDKPVVLRQKIGLGTVVLLADSFPFSNEGLAIKRVPEFLLWTLGPARKVVFDETHLGVQSGNSIAVLMREYRMHGLLIGFLILAGLWIWKNNSSFVPAYSSESEQLEDDSVSYKTNREGILHLLQRHIPTQDLPAVCVHEWAKANANAAASKRARLTEVETILASYNTLPPKDRDPIETYQIISEILSPKKT